MLFSVFAFQDFKERFSFLEHHLSNTQWPRSITKKNANFLRFWNEKLNVSLYVLVDIFSRHLSSSRQSRNTKEKMTNWQSAVNSGWWRHYTLWKAKIHHPSCYKIQIFQLKYLIYQCGKRGWSVCEIVSKLTGDPQWQRCGVASLPAGVPLAAGWSARWTFSVSQLNIVTLSWTE